jgi:hypothetical protein
MSIVVLPDAPGGRTPEASFASSKLSVLRVSGIASRHPKPSGFENHSIPSLHFFYISSIRPRGVSGTRG